MSTGPQAVQVFAYSASDPLDLDPDIIQVLPYFDGRPVDQALAAIEEERGLRVQKDLVRTLSDFEILVPAPEPGRVPKRHSS